MACLFEAVNPNNLYFTVIASDSEAENTFTYSKKSDWVLLQSWQNFCYTYLLDVALQDPFHEDMSLIAWQPIIYDRYIR